MTSLRRLLFTGVSALALSASFFLSTGCKPKSHPAPFTAKLTELEGVQAVYTLRHPKLIIGDLDKLMTEVPEAALARMFLGQLTPFGYPEFSELETGANIGIVMLELNTAELESAKPELVGFAKLKEDGKIWNALKQSGLALEKHGTWVWIAQSTASFAKVKTPDALTAYIERPQTEEVKVWGRVSPALLAKAKELLLPKLQDKLSSRPAEEQKAFVGYFNVLWNYVSQLHSGGGSLDFKDHEITLAYSAQFQPASATGTFLRYAPGTAPKIAQSVPADGLMNAVIRQNMDGQMEFVGGLIDALMAVDYPAGAEALKAVKSSYLTFSQSSDGGAVLTMDMNLPKNGQPPEIDLLGVQSGHFTEAQVNAYYKTSIALSQKFTNAMMAAVSAITPNAPVPHIDQVLTENALTIDGVNFGKVVTTTTTTVAGHEQTSSSTQYYGVVGDNLVYAMNEASLRAKLPALASKKPVANAVPATFTGDEMAIVTVPGAKIVDMVAGALTLDNADADIQAQLKSLKDGYAAAGPVKVSLGTSQAQATVTLTIPYKFIAQSVRLGQFASTHKTPAPTP
ncbi:MAG: hypothetical protein WC205_11910 [Opitutaceae bacterium]|jgi:hypothetical protein